MRIDCLHGYFIFSETAQGEVARFMSSYGFSIVREKDYYTFEALAGAPRYSIAGGTYLGSLCTKTFEGEPWEIMRENGLVYDFSSGLVVPIASVSQRTDLLRTAYYFFASGLILPGSITDDGMRVTDYAAWFYSDGATKFKYSEVSGV